MGILSNPKTLSPQTWSAHLANRLRHEWLSYKDRPPPPFKSSRGQEAHDYAELSAVDRSEWINGHTLRLGEQGVSFSDDEAGKNVLSLSFQIRSHGLSP